MQEEFGRYTLVKRLAVGGMAEIFLASLHGDAGFTKKVVVKRILPHLGADADFVKMFIDEANLAARLTHPNIVQVFDFGSIASSYFIAMEYIEGVDIHTLMRTAQKRQRTLRPAEVAVLGEGIARGLAYTHNLTDETGLPMGIVHRDVSPHNLMLSTAGDAKVMDFGIAKAAARLSRTATGTIKGKLAYMAPEQAAGHGATKYSDQFSLGVMLWECITGRRLFAGDSEVSLMQTVLACDVPQLTDIQPDVPPALADVVMRALRKDPAERFADLGDMEQALEAFRFSLGAQGMVNLKALAKEFVPAAATGETGDTNWSWANASHASGGTRPIRSAPSAAPNEVLPQTQSQPGQLRYRTTWRIDRAPLRRLENKRRLVTVGGALLALLGLGLPVALWLNAAPALTDAMSSLRRRSNGSDTLSMADGGTGRLTLRTDGPTMAVYLGASRLGNTPLDDEEVPAGKIELRLVNETSGTWKSYEVYVPEGGTAQSLISIRSP